MIYRLLADFLTVLRMAIAGIIVYLGIRFGAVAFPYAVVLVAIGWVSDGLDGPLARRSKTPTRLGRFDFLVDVTLTWATFTYLTLAGFIPWPLAVVYTLLTLVVVAHFQRKSVIVALMRPIDLTSGIIALRHAPEVTLIFIAWLIGLGVVRWRRVKTRVRAWLQDLWLLLHQKS